MGTQAGENDANLVYLNWLRTRFMTIGHIATLSDDAYSPIRLKLPDVFVPQRIRAEPPPVSLPRELWLRYLAHGATKAHDVPHDVRRDLLDQKLKEYAERPARPVLDVIADSACPRLVLLGAPGAGKSILARYIAWSLADLGGQASRTGQLDPGAVSHPLAPLERYMPFIAELRTYPKHADLGSFADVIGVLAAGAGCPSAISVREVLQSCLRERGNALVIFDGLDEVFDLELRDQLKKEITGFARDNGGARVIVTSRVTDYDRHELDDAEFAHYTLQDLDPGEVSEFARRFYRALYPTDQPEADQLTGQLLTAVRQSPAIAELVGNPLLLTSIAFLGRKEKVPPSRIDALGRTVRLLAEGWDAGRFVPKKGGLGPIELNPEDKLTLLGMAARRIMEGANGQQPRNYLSGDELKKIFSGFIADRFTKSQGDAEAIAHHLLEQLRDRDYILARFETDAYGFVHRAFLDYLAAADIRWQFSQQYIFESDVMARFQRHWREPAWQEVLPLLAGLLPPDRANRAIRELTQASPLWYLDLEPLPRHVLLATRCLGEVRHLGQAGAASEAISRALIGLFETVRERFDYGLGVTLAQAVERDALPVLAALPPDWDGRALYEAWYLARGQFLKGESPGPAQAAAARVYVTLLRRDATGRERLTSLAKWAGSQALRGAAVEALAATWRDDETAGLLQAAIRDPDWRVRRDGVRALAKYWRDVPATRDFLLDGRVLKDIAPEVRSAAVWALADAWHDDSDVATLLQGVGDGNGNGDDDVAVRAVAVRALAECFHDDPDTAPWLWKRAADVEHPKVRAVAAGVLAAGWHEDPDIVPWLSKHATKAGERHPDVRVSAVRALASGWPDLTDTAELLIATICPGSDVPEVRRAALETLAAGWRDKRRDRRVARLLSERAQASCDPDDELRYVAVQALAAYWADASQTVPVLEHLAFGDPGNNGAGADPDPYVRGAAAQALATLRPDQDTLGRLKHLAAWDKTWYVRQLALRAVAAGWRGDQATPGWLKERAALDDDADVRGSAVQVLAEGWHDAETLGWLRNPMAREASTGDVGAVDRSAQACRIATREVAAGWPDDQAYTWLCRQAVGDQHPDVRINALQLLAANPEWRDDPGTVVLLKDRALSDRDLKVRKAAIEVISAAWHDDQDTGGWLRDDAFPQSGSPVKLAVIRALVSDWHDDPKTCDWLRDRAASDPDPLVGTAATDALKRGWLSAKS